MKRALTLRISDKEHEMVRKLAFEQKKSVNSIMAQALREFYIKHKEKEICLKQY